jgi:non-specific serine/threonine protein kinase/NIMA (never in mitosis gene a)-related kinase
MDIIIGQDPSVMIVINILQENRRVKSELCYIKGHEDKFYVRKTYDINSFYDRNNCIDNIQIEFKKVYEISNLNNFPNTLTKYVGYCRNENQLMIAREFVNGSSMYQICSRIHQYKRNEIAEVFKQILNGINYIYDNEHFNYDIHYYNIYMNELNVKITDWGNYYINEALDRAGIVNHFRQCIVIFKDPYIYQSGQQHHMESSIYLIGLIMYSLCSNNTYKIRRFPINNILPEYTYIQDLINRMLNNNPKIRPTTQQIKSFLLANQ